MTATPRATADDDALEAAAVREAEVRGAREMLRHTVATLAYRGGKAVRGAPPRFGDFRVAVGSRTPVQILAHVGDLLDWALALVEGEHRWRDSEPTDWEAEVARFFAGLRRLDDYLVTDAPLGWSDERVFQGPIADALTHVGQLAMLRRLADAPLRGENYAQADIVAGRVGPDQVPNPVEFD
jgi:hypothetical protein